MALTKNHPLGEVVLDGTVSSVAASVTNFRAPFRGKLIQAGSVVGSTTTTAATVAVTIAGTAVTGGSYTIATASPAGDQDFVSTDGVGANGTITGANIANEGDAITMTITGSGTAGGNVYLYATLQKLA